MSFVGKSLKTYFWTNCHYAWSAPDVNKRSHRCIHEVVGICFRREEVFLAGWVLQDKKVGEGNQGYQNGGMHDPAEKMLDERDDSCKTYERKSESCGLVQLLTECCRFVCAIAAANSSCALFRSYHMSELDVDHDVMVWEAARATTAAPTFFKAINIGRPGSEVRYVDGTMGHNNPVKIVIQEAHKIYGNSIDNNP